MHFGGGLSRVGPTQTTNGRGNLGGCPPIEKYWVTFLRYTQIRLNWSRCRLGADSCEPKEGCIYMGQDWTNPCAAVRGGKTQDSNAAFRENPLTPLVIITHAGCIAAGMGRAFSRVCLFACLSLSVCPHSKRKTAWAINTKLGTHILYSIC